MTNDGFVVVPLHRFGEVLQGGVQVRGNQHAGIPGNKYLFQTRLFVARAFVLLIRREDFFKQFLARTNPSLMIRHRG